MGTSKSKIPKEIPGQRLLLTGIQKFDKFFSDLEPTIKVLEDQQLELNTRTTNLIEELRAEEQWQTNPDIEALLKMILTLLAVAGHGVPQKVAVFSSLPPYISLNPSSLPNSYSKIIEKFFALIKTISKISDQLQEVKISAHNIKFSNKIQKKIVKKAIRLDYSAKELVQCANIVNRNHDIIKSMPRLYQDLGNATAGFTEIVVRVLKEAQSPPLSDILLHRGIQAISSRQKTPKQIISRYWPLS